MRQNALLDDIFEIYSINTSTSDASRNFNKNEKRRDIFICITVGGITANRAAR
jgi:hypothetical protein